MAGSKHNLVKRGIAEIIDGKLVITPLGRRLLQTKIPRATLSPSQIILLNELQTGLRTGAIHASGKNELLRKIVPIHPRKARRSPRTGPK